MFLLSYSYWFLNVLNDIKKRRVFFIGCFIRHIIVVLSFVISHWKKF